jgi:hypothetical protein
MRVLCAYRAGRRGICFFLNLRRTFIFADARSDVNVLRDCVPSIVSFSYKKAQKRAPWKPGRVVNTWAPRPPRLGPTRVRCLVQWASPVPSHTCEWGNRVPHLGTVRRSGCRWELPAASVPRWLRKRRRFSNRAPRWRPHRKSRNQAHSGSAGK